MKNFLLEGVFDINDILDEYISNNEILKKASSIALFIYNGDYSDISYKVGDYSFDIENKLDLFGINLNHALICEKNTEIRKVEIDKSTGKGEGYLLSVRNPVTDKRIYVSSMLVNYEELPNLEEFSKNLNFNYFENFQFHIQTVANNYEKLFYIVDVFSDLLSKRDKYMPYHMSNVALWCNKIADKLELEEKEHILLYVAALVHDIGKLFVSEDIINKPAKLTIEECEIMKSHSEKSEVILRAILYGMTFFNPLPSIVRHHHEHFDGNGYPDGLVGAEIPLLSRILTVGDGIDAMLSRRAYKEPKSVPEIVRELSIKSGMQYDPIISNAAIEVIEESGSFVDINAMSHVNFISNASLSFYIKEYENLQTIAGNLMIKNKHAMFIFDATKYVSKDIELKDIFKPTVGFFGSNDFYEFSCDLTNKHRNDIELSNLNFIPTDTYFSIFLQKNIEICIKEESFNVEMLKFGGDTVVLRLYNITKSEIDEKLTNSILIRFDDEIIMETGVLELNCRLIKAFNSGEYYTGIFKYIEITSAQRDSILRFLFRKQIENRKQIKNAK